MKVLDLCSGFGGFSEAFFRCPHWQVMRIEINSLLSEVPDTEIIDVLEFRDILADMIERGYQPARPDLILASPPCRDFSTGFSSPRSQSAIDGELNSYQPDMSILKACLDIISMLKPTYYIIENVRGSIRYFEPYLGKPICSVGAWWFYGKFPSFNVNLEVPEKRTMDKRHSPLRVQHKSVIPLVVSQSIKKAIETQTSLFQF
jgi:hypothetical protein